MAALSNRPAPRRGLTLMELVVVLTILVGLAAVLVPLFPNLLRRTHKATDATQTSEVAKAVQLYQASYISYPDNFDLLTDGGTAFPAYLPGGSAAPFGGFVGTAPGNLTADEVAALGRVGITKGQKMPATAAAGGAAFHPTMNPYAGTVAADTTTLATGTGVALLDKAAALAANPAFLASEFAADPTARYVVFGVGARNAMVNTVMMQAPTSVPQAKDFTPDNTYCRVGVIFKVSGAEVAKSERARLIAVVALEDDELETTEKDIVGYYGVSASP